MSAEKKLEMLEAIAKYWERLYFEKEEQARTKDDTEYSYFLGVWFCYRDLLRLLNNPEYMEKAYIDAKKGDDKND